MPDTIAQYDEGFKLKQLPEDLSSHELGFAIDLNVVHPQFYFVHPNLVLEKIVTDKSSAMARSATLVQTAMTLAHFWLQKNGVKQPPRRIHIRTDYDSQRGPLGAVNSFDYDLERRSYVYSKEHESTPKTTLELQ